MFFVRSGEERLAMGLILTPVRYCCKNTCCPCVTGRLCLSLQNCAVTQCRSVLFVSCPAICQIFLVGTEWFDPSDCGRKGKTKLAEYKNRNSLFIDKKLNNDLEEKELKERGVIHPSDLWTAGSLKLLVEHFMRSTLNQEPRLHCRNMLVQCSEPEGPHKPLFLSWVLMFVWPHCCGGDV